MSRHNPVPPKNWQAYFEQQPEVFRQSLEELRTLILSIVPGATESISYQVPCFKYLYMLVGIGVNKEFVSLYTMSPTLVKSMAVELQGFKVSGATIHFPPGKNLPLELVRSIVKARVRENEQLAAAKKSK
jgi:uncharacterized protein YdhG (YjbR/CyaY superfamily)